MTASRSGPLTLTAARLTDFGRRVDAAMVAELVGRLPAPPRHGAETRSSKPQRKARSELASVPP